MLANQPFVSVFLPSARIMMVQGSGEVVLGLHL
jgi:hypothetical protein